MNLYQLLFCHAGGNEALRQGSGASVYCTAKSEPCHRTAGGGAWGGAF